MARLSQKALAMRNTKNAFGRNALSVRILTDARINVKHEPRNQKLPASGWTLVSLSSGPIWIKESETGEIIVTDEPP